MEKKSMSGSIGAFRIHLSDGVKFGQRYLAQHRLVQNVWAKKWVILHMLTALLLGRAVILDGLSPFALPFFAVIYYLRKDMIRPVGISLLAGSLLSPYAQTLYIAAQLAVFLLLQKGIEKFERSDISYVPFFVLFSTLSVQVFGDIVGTQLSWYAFAMSAAEALLSFILTLIFIQALPVYTLSRKTYNLKTEEMICLIILMASALTGTAGWQPFGVSIEHILSRYLILLFALAGGAPLGASFGVIAGLILSLANVQAVYQMSLLAFSGLLAGLFKEGNKMAVAFGMLLGSSILSVYIGDQSDVMKSTWESVAAVALFLLTPRQAVQTIAKYVPGTQENLKSQHDYARRVRDITASRVQQFSEVFRQLSRCFKQLTGQEEVQARSSEDSHFMDAVAHKVCGACYKRRQCWDVNFYRTYRYMTDMMTTIESKGQDARKSVPREWKQICIKTDQVMSVMYKQYEEYNHNLQWKKQIWDSRQLVAEQLTGVSQVMEDLAREIQREGQELFAQEEQIRRALEQLGLSIHSVDIISLDEGNVEIEMIHPYTQGFDECRKIIAPLLSDILGENIAVKREQYARREGDGLYLVTFGSAIEYEVDTGIAGAAKGGELLSGDSFTTVELGNGKFAVAVSDGMGNGERARAESSAALSLLQQLLQSGMDEKLAIKSVNSVLLLRSSDEVFATIDLALIDMYSAETTFLKIGSIPSFIRRGKEVLVVSANNLPIGILQDIDVELVTHQLEPGDVLIMMTDGVFDAPGPAVNKELWMKRVIQEIEADDPQDIADCLLETIVRYHHGDIVDDMTVVVAKISKHRPEWATFRWPGVDRLERPKTVS